MRPTDVDPTLVAGEPAPERLDDGFSPPPADGQPELADAASYAATDELLSTQSAF